MSCSIGLKNKILAVLGDGRMRLTPSALEREICRQESHLTKKVVRTAIKALVAEGLLLYTNHFNTTHLELNYNRPNQVSDRIFLLPNVGTARQLDGNAFGLRIYPGSAFGLGDHPTTRLALRGLDFVMQEAGNRGQLADFQALDIGTGSGVLAIAAVGLGASKAVGIDIDSAALYEAGQNIELNGMDQKIELTNCLLEDLDDSRFSLVMANLRPPTLKQMLPAIMAKSIDQAYWVFSGFRQEALAHIAACLPAPESEIIWHESICEWAALAARYTD